MTVKAMDVSNYSGECDFRDAYKHGVRHVIVRLTTEAPGKREIAQQQLVAARVAGMSTSGYTMTYEDQDPYDFGARVMDVAVECGVRLEYVWEDEELDGLPPVSWRNHFLRGLGADQPAGIYTRQNWWEAHTSPEQDQNVRDWKMPLWLARYDVVLPKRPTIGPAKFGPWKRAAGRQYANSGVRYGVLCDLNVMGRGYV